MSIEDQTAVPVGRHVNPVLRAAEHALIPPRRLSCASVAGACKEDRGHEDGQKKAEVHSSCGVLLRAARVLPGGYHNPSPALGEMRFTRHNRLPTSLGREGEPRAACARTVWPALHN